MKSTAGDCSGQTCSWQQEEVWNIQARDGAWENTCRRQDMTNKVSCGVSTLWPEPCVFPTVSCWILTSYSSLYSPSLEGHQWSACGGLHVAPPPMSDSSLSARLVCVFHGGVHLRAISHCFHRRLITHLYVLYWSNLTWAHSNISWHFTREVAGDALLKKNWSLIEWKYMYVTSTEQI